MKWPDQDEPPACSRLHAWLNGQDAQSTQRTSSDFNADQFLETAIARMRTARRPLIWLESVDVPVAQAAVKLAMASRATLHVAQSPGSLLTSNLMSTDGWLGTSLAEVGSTATLIVHVGQAHLQAAPMLASRYFNADAEHVYLGPAPALSLEDADLSRSIVQLNWSKAQWLDGLSRVLLIMRDDSAALSRRAEPLDADASVLVELLLSHPYSVWLWDEDELSDELDRLLVQRMAEIARYVSQTSRSSLLSLALDPGRVTAKDCVLWLTNCTTPLRMTEEYWMKETNHCRSLQDWREAFDWIVCIRNLPSDRPLPDVSFDCVLDAHCNAAQAEQGFEHRLLVQAAGLDSHGHLLRGDHGLAAFLPAVLTETSQNYSHAADVLSKWTARVAALAFASSQEQP